MKVLSMKRLTYRNSLGESYLEYGADAIWSKCERYDVLKKAIEKLAEYEDVDLTPNEIEHMKARMQSHQLVGESTNKISIFGVPVLNRQIVDDRAFEKKYNIEWHLGNGKLQTTSAVMTSIENGYIFFRYPSGGIFILKDDAIRSLECLE